MIIHPLNTLEQVASVHVLSLPTTPPLFHTKWVPGDGNCQFTAFGKAVGVTSASEVRATAIRWLRDNELDMSPYVTHHYRNRPQSYSQYVTRMSKDKEWGDNLTLHALCTVYHAHVTVLKRGDRGVVSYNVVGDIMEADYIFSLFLTGNHYENLLVASQLL